MNDRYEKEIIKMRVKKKSVRYKNGDGIDGSQSKKDQGESAQQKQDVVVGDDVDDDIERMLVDNNRKEARHTIRTEGSDGTSGEDMSRRKEKRKEMLLRMGTLDNINGMGYQFKNKFQTSQRGNEAEKNPEIVIKSFKRLESKQDLIEKNPTSQNIQSEKYFTAASEKKIRARKMVRVEDKFFCSDWEKAKKIIKQEEEKLVKLIESERKTIDDPARYSLFEGLINSEYYISTDQLGGSLLEFGFKDKLNKSILTAKSMCLMLFDISCNTYTTLYCKPSQLQKTIFLDDVRI